MAPGFRFAAPHSAQQLADVPVQVVEANRPDAPHKLGELGIILKSRVSHNIKLGLELRAAAHDSYLKQLLAVHADHLGAKENWSA